MCVLEGDYVILEGRSCDLCVFLKEIMSFLKGDHVICVCS